MDGGLIGHKSVLATAILFHEDKSQPQFYDLQIGCATSEEYYKTTQRTIRSIEMHGARVVSICADGLSSQRKAFADISASSTVDERFSPFYIWCANHRANLAVLDSLESSPILQQIRTEIINISIESRKKNIRTKLHTICPTFTRTRWFSLNSICAFIRNNEEVISKEFPSAPILPILQFEALALKVHPDKNEILANCLKTLFDLRQT